MKAFIVNSKDLFNRRKNPRLSLSAKAILENPKINKKDLTYNTKYGMYINGEKNDTKI